MATLNIVNKSPFEKRSLDQCLQRIGDGDALLLIEDATVVAATGTTYTEQLAAAGKSGALFVLMPDLEARGFGDKALVDGCSSVDYKGFVALAAEYDRVHSWL